MQSWVEISLPRLRSNVQALRRRLESIGGEGEYGSSPLRRPCRLIAVLKADAYGHGLELIGRCLVELGVEDYAVSRLDEGLRLRRIAPRSRILVLEGCWPGQEGEFRSADLRCAVFDHRPHPSGIAAELKLDTGMNRLGIDWRQASSRADELGQALAGVYSHFASADCEAEFTRLQIERFAQATRAIGCRRHLCNSAGLAFPQAFFDAARVGLAMYGIVPSPQLRNLEIRPLLSWKTRILSVKEAPEGGRVGYGGVRVLTRRTRLGVLPAGYAEGVRRSLSEEGLVEVHGKLAPLLGRVSMDLTTIDLTDIPGAEVGDTVTLLSDDPQSSLSAEALALKVGTVPYEVLTSITGQAQRRIVDQAGQPIDFAAEREEAV